jgi:cupin 2 domain-containing protein
MDDCGNIFAELPSNALPEESVAELLALPNCRIERIVSTGQVSPPDFWYDQDASEWVILLRGGARLLFEGESEPRTLNPGDFVHIAAHRRHRVDWTDPHQPTVWLAVHYRSI